MPLKGTIQMENNYNEYQAIENALQSYLESSNTAIATDLKNDWYKHLSVVGEIYGDNINVSRDEFISLVESHEASPATKGRIVKIDLEKNAACAKLEFITPGGFRFTDYILMYKETGVWKASSKVFDTNIHYKEQSQENTYAVYEEIEETIQNYTNAKKAGKGELIKNNWLENAAIVGEHEGKTVQIFRDDLVGRINQEGVAHNIDALIVSVDYNGTAAYAKVLINDLLGLNYTDYFVLQKQDGKWFVAGRVYDSY